MKDRPYRSRKCKKQSQRAHRAGDGARHQHSRAALHEGDVSQAEAAQAFLATLSAEKPGFICREVVVELVWVLDRSYGATRDEIATILLGSVATDSLVVESAEDVAASAIRFAEAGHDFADLMILTAARRHAALYHLSRSIVSRSIVARRQLVWSCFLPITIERAFTSCRANAPAEFRSFGATGMGHLTLPGARATSRQ